MWYYAQGGKTFGPVSFEQLKELARTGTLRPTDHVLPVGSQQWRVAATVDGLFTGPVAAKPPMPVQPVGPPPKAGGPPPMPEDPFSSHGPQTWSIESPPLLPGGPVSGPPDEGPPRRYDDERRWGPEEPGFGRKLARHFQRLLTWNLQNIRVDEDEKRILQSQGVEDATLQRYLSWRHSLLLILVAPVFLLALLNTIDALTGGLEDTSGFGKAVLVFFVMFPFALPFTALLALIVWYRPKLSWRLLLLGWVIGTAGPLLLLVIPRSAMLDVDGVLLKQLGGPATEEQRRMVMGALRLIFGLTVFAIVMLQLLIFGLTAAYGAQRASLRLKTLLPQSSIPGLFLAVTAPVYTLLLLPFFATINQLAPNPLLFFGMIFIMGSPLVFSFFFKRMVAPFLEARDFTRLRVLQILSSALFWLGVFLILIYALAVPIPFFDVDKMKDGGGGVGEQAMRPVEKSLVGFSAENSWFRPWSWRLLRWLLVEVLGRSLFTMILVADLFMRVNSYVWLSSRRVMGSGEAKDYDELMERLQTSGKWDKPG